MATLIGVDIGGTKCAVILGESSIGSDIKILDKLAFPTSEMKGPKDTISRIIKNINFILEKNKLNITKVKGIGISCGGPLNSKTGVILSPPNLIGWDNVHIVDIFESTFGIKTRLQNDANACALAEWKFGAGKGFNNVIFLTFGTGLGAGLILDGRLYSGTNDMAGEVGHIRLSNFGPVGYGKAGSFESFCSGGGIAQLAGIKVLEKLQVGEKVSFCKSIGEIDKLDAKIVGEAAENGDKLAIEIYKTSGHYLGKGLSILIDILNPEVIIIGSIFTRSKELLYNSAIEVINSEALKHSKEVCKILPAELGEKVGDYASLAVALYE